jgi:putative sterol carrier protein
LQALDEAARTSRDLAELGRESTLVIEQRVSDTPNGDLTYHVIVDKEGARVVVGRAPAPDVTLATDFATAAALHRGDTNAQQAMAAGRFTIGGRIDELVRRREAFERLTDVFASVRSSTTGPPEEAGNHR